MTEPQTSRAPAVGDRVLYYTGIRGINLPVNDPADHRLADRDVGQQPAERQRQLVGRVAGVGLDPPRVRDLLTVEDAHDGVGVADVDG